MTYSWIVITPYSIHYTKLYELTIYHAGNIVINGDVKAGKNCKLHGSNCIGNNGKEFKCPVLGDNVRLGVGAKVIGDVTIADNITIASGSVVVNSFLEPGILRNNFV